MTFPTVPPMKYTHESAIRAARDGNSINKWDDSLTGLTTDHVVSTDAAVYFDPGVDTIFEIGGQDAKYTYVTNSVASDYAMNEACSAGTGSFLEESAYETMGVQMEI